MPYGYITKLSDKLTREHVRYNNRYGTAIAADIYYVKDIDKNAKYNEFYFFMLTMEELGICKFEDGLININNIKSNLENSSIYNFVSQLINI